MNKIYRPLGAGEKVFWLLDQTSQVHFVITAAISGEISEKELRLALNAVQQRHPLFSVYIDSNGYKHPVFRQMPETEIPLRIIQNGAKGSLEKEFEQELSTPFNWAEAPLIRAAWIQYEKQHLVMLTIYHAIGDGISSAFVIRDLLTALSGASLAPILDQPSASELLGIPSDAMKVDDEGEEGNGLPFKRKPQPMPQVELLSLSKELTESLVRTAREEGTTVQGALCAAFVRASRLISQEWKTKPIRIVTPVSIRDVIGAGEGSSLAFIAKKPVFEPGNGDGFWDLARHATDILRGAKDLEHVNAGVRALHELIFGEQTTEELGDILQNLHVPRELMISNLGKLNFQTQFGTLKLEAIWGPLALSGYTGEQTIGVATVDGAMYLSVVSRTPLKSLLAKAKFELVNASGSIR